MHEIFGRPGLAVHSNLPTTVKAMAFWGTFSSSQPALVSANLTGRSLCLSHLSSVTWLTMPLEDVICVGTYLSLICGFE